MSTSQRQSREGCGGSGIRVCHRMGGDAATVARCMGAARALDAEVQAVVSRHGRCVVDLHGGPRRCSCSQRSACSHEVRMNALPTSSPSISATNRMSGESAWHSESRRAFHSSSVGSDGCISLPQTSGRHLTRHGCRVAGARAARVARAGVLGHGAITAPAKLPLGARPSSPPPTLFSGSAVHAPGGCVPAPGAATPAWPARHPARRPGR